jgi:DNA-binding GntR family transcriptional regulator
LTPDQVVDLMHVRRLLEVDAVRLATPRIRIPDLIALEKILSESAEVEAVSWSHGYRQFNQLDKQFHLTLFRLSGSQFLLGVYRSLNVHVELGRFYPVFVDMDHRATLNEHRAVFGALKAREVETAAAALTAHLNATEERILRLIDKHTLALAIAGAKSKERDV